MERFTITTSKAVYSAKLNDANEWIVDIDFKDNNVSATYTFNKYEKTAVAQQIFNIDKHLI